MDTFKQFITEEAKAGFVKGPYGGEDRVEIRKGYDKGGKVYKFHATGWKPMKFADHDSAAKKLASHHNFTRWED